MKDFYKNKNIFISLSYVCNAYCEKCMTRHHINKDKEMDIATIDLIAQKLKENNYTGCISVGTGEPLLYKNIGHFIEKMLNINDKIRLRILTNGKSLETEVPSIIHNPRCTIGITLDGFVQTDLEGLQQGIDIEKVKNNIKDYINKYGENNIYLNYTLNRKNYKSLIDFCKFAISLNVKEVYVTPLKVFEGFEEKIGDYVFKYTQEQNEILKKSKFLLELYDIKCGGFENKNDIRYGCFLKNYESPVIDVTGDVSFCCGREDIIVANIKEQEFDEKWQTIYNLLSRKNDWCQYCGNNIKQNGTYALPKVIDLSR